MGSVNTSVSLRLPPGAAGCKRVFSASTTTPPSPTSSVLPAATATTTATAAAIPNNNNNNNSNKTSNPAPGGRFVADHHDYHLQRNLHRVNGGGDSGLNGGGGGGGGLKPLTNGRGTFTLVKRGGVISNGGKMVTTSTNGGSNTASNENSHVREIYTSPPLFNGAGGTATVTAIVPTTARVTSNPTATTSTFSAFNNNNNNRLKSNNNSGKSNNGGSNNQMNHNSGTSPSAASRATNTTTSGVMLPPNKKLTGSKTTIIIGRVNSQQTREINGNHNYSVRDVVTKPSTITTVSKMTLIGSNSMTPTTTAAATTPTAAASTASATIPVSASMRLSTTTPGTTKTISAAATAGAVTTRNTMSTTEDEEDEDDNNGIVSTMSPSRLRLTSNPQPTRGIATPAGSGRSTLLSSSSSNPSPAAATAATPEATSNPTASTTFNANAAGAATTTNNLGPASQLATDATDESEIAKRKDELPSSSSFVARFSADPGHIFAVDCEAQLRKLHELTRKNDAVSQRIHRIQTKSTVEVAYSELKQVIAGGQEIFKMPCLMSKSGQIAAQLANKEKSGAPLQRKLGEGDSAKLVRGCGIHSTLIANSEKLCDSSATESSSEEEDLPEKVEIFNGRKILTPFQYASSYSSCSSQHPAWRWACERASLGARWTWLQAQVSELEYRIRQQHELCRQLRLRKEPCLQQPEHPNNANEEHSRCARTTPLNKNFTKRRLVDAHTISAEVAESVPLDALSLSCECGTMYPQVELCVRCTLLHAQSARERFDISEERQQEEFQLTRQLMAIPLWDSQSEISRMAVYDETYHPVLSGKHDISLSLHYENLLRMGYSLLVHKNAMAENSSETAAGAGNGVSAAANAARKRKEQQTPGSTPQQHMMNQQQRSAAATPEPASEIDDDAPPVKRRRQIAHAANRPSRSEKRGNTGGALRPPDGVSKKRRADRRFATAPGRRSMSVDSQEQADDELFADIGDRNNPSRTRRTSNVVHQEYGYDIDNIVIPYGMMSSTRLVEPLKYKEILTPKWRILHLDSVESKSKDNELSAQAEGSAAVIDKVASKPSANSSFAMDDEDTVLAVKENESEEDISDAAFEVRHARQETLERERFSVYLQPKLVSNIGSPSAANARGRRAESTDAQKSKDLSTQTAASQVSSALRAKEIHDESSFFGDIGGKTESTAKLHASKAKRQHRSLSQDWTMLQSSSAPTPYPARNFPLSDEEFERILQENSVPDEVEKGCETVSVDESSNLKAKEKPRKSILKSGASSSPTTASQTSMAENKLDDPSASKAFLDQQPEQQQLRHSSQENKQEQSIDREEDLTPQQNAGSKPSTLSLQVGNAESLDVEDNSEEKLASNKSEQNEDFDMADENSNSNPSNHGHVHWLNVGCDKVNEADILDEIANSEWSADDDETEPDD